MQEPADIAEVEQPPRRSRRRRRDEGSSFIELLVSIVLLGIGGLATMTALSVTIQGSDQHKSKIGALAELEGAAAYLTRAVADEPLADCSATLTASFFDGYLSDPALVNPNPGVTVEATAVSCARGVAEVTLVATHATKANATESLNVAVGGISVLEDGIIGSGPAPGGCMWTGVSFDHNSVILKANGQINTAVTVELGYTGDCTSETVTIHATDYPASGNPRPNPASMNLSGHATFGEFEKTYSKNYFNWVEGPVELQITTSDGYSETDSFTVDPL